MAIVVESTATTAETFTSSLVITKPTGLAVTDVLIAVIFSRADAAIPAIKSGWTNVTGVSSSPTSKSVRVLTKIADSSDVAASNFSFDSSGGTQNMSGILMRGSGVANDLTLFATGRDTEFTSEFGFTGTLALTPPTENSLLVFIAMSQQGTDFSGYSVSGTNPTWTERFQGGTLLAVATAVRPSDAEITSFSYTMAGATSSLADQTGVLVSLGERTDVSGTNTLVTTTTTAFGQAGTCDTTGTNVLTETTSESFAQSGTGSSPTQWTNEAKPSTTWVNEEK